jgi:methyl-accepting chemotaxis protein
VDQISKAVAEMDKVVQQNAANAEESASASEELSAQAEQVKGVVGELVALVGGNHQGGNGQADRGRSRYQPDRQASRAEKTLTLTTRGKKP